MASIILINKPFQVLCQFTDQQGRPTLAEFVDQPGFYPAGRLDYDSEGLVVLTNSGPLQHRISDPKAKLSKTYWVQVEGEPSDNDLEPLRRGITLKDGHCRPAKTRIIQPPALWERTPPVRHRQNQPTRWLEITLTEGRNRQVRRMTAAIGFPTLRLVRCQIGDWRLEALLPGESRQLQVHLPSKTRPRSRN